MYPLKFEPLFQKRLWGAKRLGSLLGKPVGDGGGTPIGESWEIADLPAGTVKADSQAPGVSADGSFSNRIANGPLAGATLHDFWRAVPEESTVRGLPSRFPLLVKFLDAAQDLSVQVHPDAAYCRAHADAHLKSEAWYILHAEPGAKIYRGLRPGTTRQRFKAALESGSVQGLLNTLPVRAGECYYLPSGTVHALGAGILAAEVQTPSDTTYRVFDWNRLGPDGKPRALHVDEALACMDFEAEPERPRIQDGAAGGERLVECDYFTIDRVRLAQGESRPMAAEWVVWIVVEGQGVIACDGAGPTAFTRGESLLLPASMRGGVVTAIAPCAWLEARPVIGT